MKKEMMQKQAKVVIGQALPDVKIKVIPECQAARRVRGSSTHLPLRNLATNDKRGRFPIETLGNDANFMGCLTSPLAGEDARRAGEGDIKKSLLTPLIGLSGLRPSNHFPREGGSHTTRRLLRGFTLIELLVVVLIIGILAAVALPKYQLAVDKARFMKLLTPMESISKAIDAYYLANGTFPTQWDELGIILPGTVDTTGHYLFRGTASFSLAYQGVSAQDSTFSGIIIYRFSDYRTDVFGGKTACYAKTTKSRATTLCKNLSGKTLPNADASNGDYLIYFIN